MLLPPGPIKLPLKHIFGLLLILSAASGKEEARAGRGTNTSASIDTYGQQWKDGAQPSYTDSLQARASELKGLFLCGKVPYPDAVVRLYRNNTETIENLLSVVKSGADGMFRIEGNTAGRNGDDAHLTPHIKLFHKCDDKEKTKGHRTFGWLVNNPSYVTLGRVSRKTFDIGTLNLEIVFPGETRDLKYTDLQPLGALIP